MDENNTSSQFQFDPTSGKLIIQGPPSYAAIQKQNNESNAKVLKFLLPTLGAVAAGPLGLGILGAGALAAGGQGAADAISGQMPGLDVPLAGATTVGGGLLGKAIGGVAGKIGGNFKGAADALSGKPTQDIFNGVVQKDPFMTQNTAKLAKTASSLGYMDRPISHSLDKMPQDFENINQQIKGAVAANNTEIPIVSGVANKPSLLDSFHTQLQKASVGEGNADFDKAINVNLARMKNLSNNGVSDASSIYGEKADMSKLLSSTFDRQARGVPLSPKEEANLAYFSALKDTLNHYGSPEVAGLNTVQNHMYDIAKAFGTQYAKQQGKSGAPLFSFRNLFPEELGGAGALAVGANPILGAALGFGANKITRSPAALQAGGAMFSELGNVLGSKAAKIIAPATGAAVGTGLNSVLGINNATNNTQYQETNQGNQNPLISFLGGQPNQPNVDNVAQSGTNVNSTATIPAFNGKDSFPASLPDISQIQNTIPGQTYTPAQYDKDLQQYQQDVLKAGNNPVALEQVAAEKQGIDARRQNSQEIANNYIQQNGLDGDQIQFMRSAVPTYDSMNQLRQLVQQQGGRNLFQAVLNDNPQVQQFKARTDPSGNYSLMLNLMNQLRGQAARAAQGGRASTFELSLVQAFSPGNTVASNLANLDHAQSLLYKQYQQYAPTYSLLLQANPGSISGQQASRQSPSPSVTGNPHLDSILSQ